MSLIALGAIVLVLVVFVLNRVMSGPPPPQPIDNFVACSEAYLLMSLVVSLSSDPSGLPESEGLKSQALSLRAERTADPALNAALGYLADKVIIFADAWTNNNGTTPINMEAAVRSLDEVGAAYSTLGSYCK